MLTVIYFYRLFKELRTHAVKFCFPIFFLVVTAAPPIILADDIQVIITPTTRYFPPNGFGFQDWPQPYPNDPIFKEILAFYENRPDTVVYYDRALGHLVAEIDCSSTMTYRYQEVNFRPRLRSRFERDADLGLSVSYALGYEDYPEGFLYEHWALDYPYEGAICSGRKVTIEQTLETTINNYGTEVFVARDPAMLPYRRECNGVILTNRRPSPVDASTARHMEERYPSINHEISDDGMQYILTGKEPNVPKYTSTGRPGVRQRFSPVNKGCGPAMGVSTAGQTAVLSLYEDYSATNDAYKRAQTQADRDYAAAMNDYRNRAYLASQGAIPESMVGRPPKDKSLRKDGVTKELGLRDWLGSFRNAPLVRVICK